MFDHLHATAFQYTPLGLTILGPARNINMNTKDHLQKYIETYYTAPIMVMKHQTSELRFAKSNQKIIFHVFKYAVFKSLC